MMLVSVSSWEVASVTPVSAKCVVRTAVTLVEMNVTVMVSLSCMVEKYGFESEVDEEPLLKGEDGPLCWSSGEGGGKLG